MSQFVYDHCTRSVNVTYSWNDVGWQAWDPHAHILISAVIIGAAAAVILAMFVWLLRHEWQGFNSTNVLSPVVIMAKSSPDLEENVLVDLGNPPTSRTELTFRRTRPKDRNWAGGFILSQPAYARSPSDEASESVRYRRKDSYVPLKYDWETKWETDDANL